MKIVGIIPARWASTRLEGKVLADILGKPMIQHVWERAKRSSLLDEVYIACDNDNVFRVVEEFGAKAIMTSSDHTSGTDRIAEAAARIEADVILNIQGDEPLIEAAVLDALAQAMQEDPLVLMATVIKKFDSIKEIESPNVVKVVIDIYKDAIYFSRSSIPFYRDTDTVNKVFYKHLGFYAYRREFLLKYKDLPASSLEQAERLEQLRALEGGVRIRTIQTDYDTISVDTPEDLHAVIERLKEES